MPRQSDARQKMIRSAAVLFRERGVQGTSFADVLDHSGAPRGSIYHHFRGGKTQLAEEATRWAGEFIAGRTAAALAARDPAGAIDVLRDQWTRILQDSDFRAGCTVVAATLEGEREPTVRDVAGEAFAGWRRLLADAFAGHGIGEPRARSLATLVVASIEGAIVLARAQRSTEPLEQVAAELRAVVEHAMEEDRGGGR
jgi:AcrR family transcriptional regulator